MANEKMQREFVANGGEKPRRERTKQGTLKRSKGVKKATPKKLDSDQYLKGAKEMALYLHRRYDPDGPTCEECGIAGNARTLDLDHITPRARGGHDRPDNLHLLCNRFANDCHGKKHGRPFDA